ncbi:MAG: diguanylate cyclase (GGDEF)-like protein [Arenicella sp.]|jgi:diguanylate cyclase (GGDEF)-like protein
MKQDDKHLEEMIEVDDGVLTLKEIEYISVNEKVRKRYGNRYKKTLYSNILMSLTHESYTEEEATCLWWKIIKHMGMLNGLLNREVGISVATLDYLTNITQTLSEPIIIEQGKSAFVSRATTTDELTSLYLRDVFDVMLKKEVNEASRKNNPLCLLIIDIDDFKTVNDEYGHLAGDKALTEVGSGINSCVREMDFAARYGGEELAVIMPDTNIEQGFKIAERIRKHIENLQFDGFGLTVSAGLSMVSHLTNTPYTLITSADEALYIAKCKGKNQVMIAESLKEDNE